VLLNRGGERNVILRRMPDYVNYICPQFHGRHHVNFQEGSLRSNRPIAFVAAISPTAGRELLVNSRRQIPERASGDFQ